MRLSYNVMSMNVFRNYSETSKVNSKALSRISSGSKIMSAKDNPNKLGQSEGFKLQIRGLQAAQRNVQNGASMMQTFDGALDGISESLIRMRELTVKAGNSTNTEEDMKVIQKEIEQIKNGIDDLAKNTEFNGVKLIGGNGVNDNRFPGTIKTVSGANVGETIDIPKYNVGADFLTDATGKRSIRSLDISKGDITEALETIDQSMKTINEVRGKFGALETRFTNLSKNFDENNIMLSRAQGNIEGADIAKEMMEFTRTNILIEAANVMIAQTNNLPNDALKVLERIN